MKNALLALFVLCAPAAFGQAAAATLLSAQPQIYSFYSHPEHAARQALAPSQNLNAGEIYVYAQGERPLYELATPIKEVPLGDSARMLREEHASAKRAVRYWQNQ